MENHKKAAFFDLDNTLISGSSSFYFIKDFMSDGSLKFRNLIKMGLDHIKFVHNKTEDSQAMANIRTVALSIAPDKVLSSVSSDLSEFTYGQQINLSGSFTLADKSPIAALPIHVETKGSTDLNWREITSLTTGKDGKVSLPVYLGASQSIRLRSDGTWERNEGLSNIQDLIVRPQIKITAPTSVQINSKFTITGRVTPGKLATVALEKFDGKWSQVATTTADQDGAYTFTYSSSAAPFLKLRTNSGGATSAAVTVVIR